MGLFVDSGKILSITGPWGGLLAFGFVGLCVSCVMETFSEMQGYWPIPNGPVEYVRIFIDGDLGAILGFAYWQVTISMIWGSNLTKVGARGQSLSQHSLMQRMILVNTGLLIQNGRFCFTTQLFPFAYYLSIF